MAQHAVEPRQQLPSRALSARGAELARLDRHRWEQEAAKERQKKEASAALLARRKAYAPPAGPLPGSPKAKAAAAGANALPPRPPVTRTQQRPSAIARSNTAPIRGAASPSSQPGGLASTSHSPPTFYYCASPLHGSPLHGSSPPVGQTVRCRRSAGAPLRTSAASLETASFGISGSDGSAEGEHGPSASARTAAKAPPSRMQTQTDEKLDGGGGSPQDGHSTHGAFEWTFGWRGARQTARLAATHTAADSTSLFEVSPPARGPAAGAEPPAKGSNSLFNSFGYRAAVATPSASADSSSSSAGADVALDVFTLDAFTPSELAALHLPGPALATLATPVRMLGKGLLGGLQCRDVGGREADATWEAVPHLELSPASCASEILAGSYSDLEASPAPCAYEILADSQCDFEAEEAEALKAALHADRAALVAELGSPHNRLAASPGGSAASVSPPRAGVSSPVRFAEGRLEYSGAQACSEETSTPTALRPSWTWGRSPGVAWPEIEAPGRERACIGPTKQCSTAQCPTQQCPAVVPLASSVTQTACPGADPLPPPLAAASAPDLPPDHASTDSAREWTIARAAPPPQASCGYARSQPCFHAQPATIACSQVGGASLHNASTSTMPPQAKPALCGFFGRLGFGPQATPPRCSADSACAVQSPVGPFDSATCAGRAAGAGTTLGAEGMPGQQVQALMDEVEALAACLRAEQAARLHAEKRLQNEQQHTAAFTDHVAGLLRQVKEMRRRRDGVGDHVGVLQGLVHSPSGDASGRDSEQVQVGLGAAIARVSSGEGS